MFRVDGKNELEVVLEKNCSDYEESDEKERKQEVIQNSEQSKIKKNYF